MSKNNKYIPTIKKGLTKVPDSFEWKLVNLTAYEELKQKVAKGEKTLLDLKEFESKFRESADERERRWRREYYVKEVQMNHIKNYAEFKENPKAFMTKMANMGKWVSQWWIKRPKKAIGKGKIIRSSLDGSYRQEYKPNKSMRMKDWLSAAEKGQVMGHLNPKGIPLNRKPTDEEIEFSEKNKNARKQKVYDYLLKITENFGRGWTSPKWGRLDTSEPGKPGRPISKKSYTLK